VILTRSMWRGPRQTEAKMDLSGELSTSRAAYFEALDTGEDVRPCPGAPTCCLRRAALALMALRESTRAVSRC
jgi:hypothetical protein